MFVKSSLCVWKSVTGESSYKKINKLLYCREKPKGIIICCLKLYIYIEFK